MIFLLQKLMMELGEPCLPSFLLPSLPPFFLLFIVLSKYLLSVCYVPGPVLGARYMLVCSLQSRRDI